MPHVRLRLPAVRTPRSASATAPPSGRLFGLILAVMGIALLAVAAAPILAGAQTADRVGVTDPGVRGGPNGAGGMLTGLTPGEQAFFASTRETFEEVDGVAEGLGPRFNLDSCAGCHAQPDVGGTSPALNPQIAVAHKQGASNPRDLSSFITADGPVREVRFKRNADGSPDGGVHDLFTITGRTDARGCNIEQPNFRQALAQNNAIFRIPTPVFGTGLIETIQDSTIIANKNADGQRKGNLGISGHENREGNAGTITRFGWKAQNKSLVIFAGEAYNVEQGVTNELFPNERDETPGCLFNGIPEDKTDFDTGELGDATQFSIFMRFLAAPAPAPLTSVNRSSITNGQQQFTAVGCNLCHTPTLRTGTSSSPAALSNVPVNLYSDLLVHNMGNGLADGVSQGNAGPDEFRSAPLWGVGQRIFFLHDGRTKNLVEAIQAHASQGSEANRVIGQFNGLPARDRQDIINFLRNL